MPTPVPWTPTVAAVGAVLRARTKDANGVEVGTFTDDTRPTADQVAEILEKAAEDVATVVGWDAAPGLWGAASAVAVLGAAVMVETTYYPEQVSGGRSPAPMFEEMYEKRLARLGKADAGDAAGASGDAPGMPVYAFGATPDPDTWSIARAGW